MAFIGRHDEREQIKELLISTDIQVLQIYGLPSTGKTDLIRQVCQEIRSELPAQSIYRRITNGQWLNTEMSHFLENSRKLNMLSIIVLDCLENLSKIEEFGQFCTEILWDIPCLKMILIFQGLFPLKIDGISDKQIELKPMIKEDARSLFYRRTKLLLGDHSDEQVDKLIDYCGGLPGQIIKLTNRISQLPTNTSLSIVYKFVKDNKNFCEPEDIFAKINKCIKSLPLRQCSTFSEVVYFPGTFTAKDITKMANYKNDLDTKFSFLFPLLGHGFLKPVDENNEQFQVPSLFQDYAKQHLAHLQHEDITKLKFSDIIGKTLIKAENLWEEGLIYEALGIMKNNWANVQKLLLQAIHSPSDGNSFQIYYQVVVDASKIISLCYPNEAKLFCRAIFDNAQIFGSEAQRALSMISYGHTLVESSEKEALQLYRTSEEVLRKHNDSYQLVILLYHMSKAYYQSGKLHKGIRCAEEALAIQVTDRNPADVQQVRTYAATYLAYNLIFATEYRRAEEIIQQTLQVMGESGHPAVPTLLNLLGLKTERSKGDLNKALTWYLSSLSKKRKVAKFQEPLLVPTLCNVAGQLSKTKRRHYFALRFLHEAEAIRRRAGWIHGYSALVLWNIGMVYMRQHNQFEALMKIQEAEKLYEEVNCTHYVNAEVKVWVAHCYILLDNIQEAKQVLLEVVNNRLMYHKYRPQGEFVLNALEHLIHLSITDSKEQQKFIEVLLEELSRLNQSPGVCPISLKKYYQLRLKYREILQKISINTAKTEPHFGIFLACIPDTCLACQEVLNYEMCPRDIYLQKMNSLTPTCKSFDKITRITIRSVAHKEPQEQSEISRTSEEIDNSPSLKSISFNSNILPLPVKELCKSSVHLESVGSHQEVSNVLPDFDALLSLEENCVGCENKRVHPEVREDISERQNSTSKTIVKNSITENFSRDLTGESQKLFEKNRKILKNKLPRDLPNSTKTQQTANNQEIYCRNLAKPLKDAQADTLDMLDFSASLTGTRTDQKLQTCLKPQSTMEVNLWPCTKEKPIVPSQKITNQNNPSQLQKNNSILSKDAKIDSAKSSYNLQPHLPEIIQEQQNQAHFWKNYRGCQHYSTTKTESTKRNETTCFGHFKEKRTVSKYSEDCNKSSTTQKPFSTIPIELQLLNGSSSFKTDQNRSCTNDKSARHQMNNLSKNQFSQLRPRFISRRETGPVEHDEKLN